MKKKLLTALGLSFVLIVLLFSCDLPSGTSANSSNETEETEETGISKEGYFIDGPLANLKYITSSGTVGFTDINGKYDYLTGDNISFFLGSQQIGVTIKASGIITPLTICDATDLSDGSEESSMAINMIRLFLALDTGENAYGLVLPEEAHQDTAINYNTLLNSDDFAVEVLSLISAIKDIENSAVDLPSEQAAQDHWEISQTLIEGLEDIPENTNLLLTVKIPDNYANSILNLSYRAESMLPGMVSYISGTSRVITATTNVVNFTGNLHSSAWRLTLSLFKNSSKVQAGDILSFYDENGFTQIPPNTYPLNMTSGRKLLQSDLSSGEGLQISAVHTVSGNLMLPKILPDNTDLITITKANYFSLFFSIINEEYSAVAFSNLQIPLSESEEWSEIVDNGISYYAIPFTTSLPDGYKYSIQLYYRTVYPGGYTAIAHNSFPEILSTAKTDVLLKTDTWNLGN